jgi:hypothetical protein
MDDFADENSSNNNNHVLTPSCCSNEHHSLQLQEDYDVPVETEVFKPIQCELALPSPVASVNTSNSPFRPVKLANGPPALFDGDLFAIFQSFLI